MASYTSTDLLAAIERRTFAPQNQLTYTPAELLAVADEVMQTHLLPDILAVREEFFVSYVDYAVTANQAAYDIPARAIGMKVREVHLLDGDAVTNLPRKEPEQFQTMGTGTPDSFFLRMNQVFLYPVPQQTQKTLRLYFELTPASLVATSSAAVVATIDTATNVVGVASIPGAWATGNVFDLVKQDGGQEPLAIDLTSTIVASTNITLPSLPATLRVGDYVSLAGETALPQIPPNYRAVLAQGVAAEILESMNQAGAEKARKTFDAMRLTAQKLITPRVEGEDRLITPQNWF